MQQEMRHDQKQLAKDMDKRPCGHPSTVWCACIKYRQPVNR